MMEQSFAVSQLSSSLLTFLILIVNIMMEQSSVVFQLSSSLLTFLNLIVNVMMEQPSDVFQLSASLLTVLLSSHLICPIQTLIFIVNISQHHC